MLLQIRSMAFKKASFLLKNILIFIYVLVKLLCALIVAATLLAVKH